jgi:hypothetical protein
MAEAKYPQYLSSNTFPDGSLARTISHEVGRRTTANILKQHGMVGRPRRNGFLHG